MDIGRRNHQIVIKKPTVLTVLGVSTETPVTVATLWASLKNMNQKRALENGVTNLEGTTIFNYNYYDYPTIDKTCQVFEGSTQYTINSIVVNEKVDIDLICKING